MPVHNAEIAAAFDWDQSAKSDGGPRLMLHCAYGGLVQDGIHSRLRNWESFKRVRVIGACVGEDGALASAEAGVPACKD